jgi:hypothetical protein
VSAVATRLRRLAPWLAAALLLSVVFLRVDFGATARALARADWPRFVLSAVPFAAIWLAAAAAALSRLVSRFHAPVAFRDMLRLRGGTYLFLVLSYDAAQAALALALSRRLRVPLLALGGTFLFYYAIDLLTIAGLGSLGALAIPGARGAALRPVLGGLLVVLAVAGAAGLWSRGAPARARSTRCVPRARETASSCSVAPPLLRLRGLAAATPARIRRWRGRCVRSRSRSRRCPSPSRASAPRRSRCSRCTAPSRTRPRSSPTRSRTA